MSIQSSAGLSVVSPSATPLADYQPGETKVGDLLPAEVNAFIKPQSSIPRYSENGFEGATEHWSPPVVASPSDQALVRDSLDMIEQVMQPAERPALLARVFTLLSHYRSENRPESVEQAIAEDWAEDLEEYPMWAIKEAARKWRRSPKGRFKPQICEIRELCEWSVRKEKIALNRLRQLVASFSNENPSTGNRDVVNLIRFKRTN